MAVTLKEIYLNQLASGTVSPSLAARVAALPKDSEWEAKVERASAIGGTKPTKTTSPTSTATLDLQPASAGCPMKNWEVKYFDKDTRQWETAVVSATRSSDAIKLAQTVTNGGLYSADSTTRTPTVSHRTTREGVTSVSNLAVQPAGGTTGAAGTEAGGVTGGIGSGGVTSGGGAVTGTTATGGATSPVPPELEKIISNWATIVRGYGTTGEDIIPGIWRYVQGSWPGVTEQQIGWVIEYQEYLNALKSPEMQGWPTPQNVNDYILNKDKWTENIQYYQLGYTQEQIDSLSRYQAFGSQYGDLNDLYYDDLDDYLANYDQAQQQLGAWITEAGPEATGFTDDQLRAYDMYWDYYNAYAPLGTPKPVDRGDFIANFNYFQDQLVSWQKAEATGTPGTSTSTAGQFMEAPQLGSTFTSWLRGQEEFSGALEQFTEGRYSSLRSEFEGTQPRMTGSPTEEGATLEAERRERLFKGWLGEMTPEIEQRYWEQRPSQRGEKLYAYSPPTRTINW